MLIASWNVNSIRARMEQVKTWLSAREPDVLLMQELKGTDFPAELFKEMGYNSATVTQKSYNGVAVLSRKPIEVVSATLAGDDTDSHARFLEVMAGEIRIANIYLPNGNPIGTDKFLYKLAWMDRLIRQMERFAWTGLQRCVPFLASGRRRPVHVLGLFPQGVREQPRHSYRSFPAIAFHGSAPGEL